MINSRCPVNRLPPELLTTVFSLVPRSVPQAVLFSPAFSPRNIVHTEDLFPIITTCRHWRAVAVNTPSLWSTLTDLNGHPFHLLYSHRCWGGMLQINTTTGMSETTLGLLRQNNLRLDAGVTDAIDARSMRVLASTFPLYASSYSCIPQILQLLSHAQRIGQISKLWCSQAHLLSHLSVSLDLGGL